MPSERVAASDPEEDEADAPEELISPPPRAATSAATPDTDGWDVIKTLLSLSKQADDDPETLENMRRLKNDMAAAKLQAEHNAEFWKDAALTARASQGVARCEEGDGETPLEYVG